MAARVSGVAMLPPSAGNVRNIHRQGYGAEQGQGRGQGHGQEEGEEEEQEQILGQGTRRDRMRRGDQLWNQRPVWGGNGKGWGHPRKDKDGSPNIRLLKKNTHTSFDSVLSLKMLL